MTSPKALSRHLARTMALGAIIGILAAYISLYLLYLLVFEYDLGQYIDIGQDSWLPSGPEMLTLALISLVVLAGVTALAVRLARRIATPLASVAQAARQIAEGDLSARAQPDAKPSRETALLVDDFNDMATRLEKASLEIVTWNAQIAHELRTPLTVLHGRLQGLVDGVFEPDAVLFRRLLGQVDGLTRLVEDLRVVSLVESGRLQLQVDEVDLASEIEDLAELVEPALTAAGFTLTTALGRGYARLDMMRVRQALLALIDNAQHHAAPCELRIELAMASALVEISVIDAGPGLPPDFTEDAFKVFARAERFREGGKEGSGLGLSVVQAIARAHGGEAAYSFEPGRSAFTIRLPRYALVGDRRGLDHRLSSFAGR
jgi:two-component system, OmpR family, sensor histidine kinase AdeS